MIDWRISRFIILVLLLLAVVVGVGLAARPEGAPESEGGAQERTLLVRFLDWWRREEPLPVPQVMARPAQLPRYPVVRPPVNPVPPFVPVPIAEPAAETSFFQGLVPSVVYCPPGGGGSVSPWCA